MFPPWVYLAGAPPLVIMQLPQLPQPPRRLLSPVPRALELRERPVIQGRHRNSGSSSHRSAVSSSAHGAWAGGIGNPARHANGAGEPTSQALHSARPRDQTQQILCNTKEILCDLQQLLGITHYICSKSCVIQSTFFVTYRSPIAVSGHKNKTYILGRTNKETKRKMYFSRSF